MYIIRGLIKGKGHTPGCGHARRRSSHSSERVHAPRDLPRRPEPPPLDSGTGSRLRPPSPGLASGLNAAPRQTAGGLPPGTRWLMGACCSLDALQ